jgi:mercuric ion transport protein
MKVATATAAGSVLGGFLASACCIVPLAFAALGISGAGFALRFESLRPHLLVLTYGLLGSAFYATYWPSSVACPPEGQCQPSGPGRMARIMLWTAALLVVITTAFPFYSVYLF